MTKQLDTFPDPNNSNHYYDVLPADEKIEESDLDGVDRITILSSEGAVTISADAMRADRLRRKPSLEPTPLAQVVESANFRWALLDDIDDGVHDA